MIAGKHASSPIDSLPGHASAIRERETPKLQAIQVLGELYELLEMYSPQWYTEEHHRKAVAVLQQSEKV